MGIFGWSLPPGCSTLPGEEDRPCDVCGKSEDDCICPECPKCGDYGNPECYIDHGLQMTKEQIDSLQEYEDRLDAEHESYAERCREADEADAMIEQYTYERMGKAPAIFD